MKLVKPSVEFMWCTPEPLKAIELAGRTCYKSEDKITDTSAEAFVRRILAGGHWAMIEHASLSCRVICDRGVTHEIVRHRLFSYAQESTRYCNYTGGCTFIIPPWMNLPEGECLVNGVYNPFTINGVELESTNAIRWLTLLHSSECAYTELIKYYRWTPQQARGVLLNALKTEIVITGNLREWMHFFYLRTSPKAHPQMQEIANMLLEMARFHVCAVFDVVRDVSTVMDASIKPTDGR